VNVNTEHSEFVELRLKRNRGWPWPESSYGLDPMFGEDGWCHSCGVPKKPQPGPIILQRKGFAKPTGAWMPYWSYDVYCLDRLLAEQVKERFAVELREVHWPKKGPDGSAWQMVVPTVGPEWFPEKQLRERVIAKHSVAGATCPECGVWRWLPLGFDDLPALQVGLTSLDVDVAASPEWFGDGLKAFRQVLMRRELAELLAAASPRDFKVKPVIAPG
jgi:hypothetical protein